MAMGGGRHERKPESGTGRRAVLIGGSLLGVAAVGGGAYAALTHLEGGRSGSSDGGGGGLLGGDDETTSAAPPRRIFETLADRAGSVPETATVDLSGLADPRAVTYPRVPSARGFSEAVDMSINKILREHLWAGAASGDLKITGTIFLTAADTLGAVLMQQDAAGSSASLLYYRAGGDRPLTSPGLIDPAQWGALGTAVATAAKDVEGLDATKLDTYLQQQPRPWGNGPAMLFDTRGDLHVVFPAADVNGARAEADLRIPAKTAAPLLSEDGKAVLAAATAAQPAAFDPATVSGPPADNHDGDSEYVDPVSVPAPQRARESDGAGPIGQLAPLSGSGTAPSAVVAPDATRLKAVSLTFDDGPDPDKNQTLRDHLAEHHASCTFYMIGQSVQAFPEWCGKTAAAGQEIGSHSWSHAQLSAASGDKLTREVTKPAEEIEKAAGRRPYVMRPPYGARNSRSDDAIAAVGQSAQIWDVDTEDWRTRNVEKNIAAVQKNARRGSIVLMHEIHQQSVDSVPQILTWFDQNDFTTLTASEIGQNQMWAGRYYMMGLVTKEIAPPAPPASDAGGKKG